MSWGNAPELPTGVMLLENQVAGHTAAQGCLGLLKPSNNDGTILKPTGKVLCGIREIAFYERLMESPEKQSDDESIDSTAASLELLRRIVPRYYGHPKLTIDDKEVEFIQLEDLANGFDQPCIMDVKIGSRTWDPLATPDKRKAEEGKYKACRQRFGLCIPGFQVFSRKHEGQLIRHGKDYGKKLTEANIRDAFLLFLNANKNGKLQRKLIDHFLRELALIENWARTQTAFRLYSSSVLLIYDAARLDSADQERQDVLGFNSDHTETTDTRSGWVKAKIIDFAHAFPADEAPGTVDYNYLQGIESLVGIFRQFLADDVDS
uniref:Kinase n=1 Tax=Anopheles atroparvus TaxID=41427 RepID=A0AAG5DWF3_ANOAO